MDRVIKCAMFLLLACSAASAQSAKVPRFSQFPVKVEKAKITRIDFKKNPDASSFRTRLTEGLKGGVNFAGRYVIVGWGCGTGCTNAAIINTQTGKVLWPDQFMNVDATYGDGYSEKQLNFKKDSRLLIIHGRPGTKNENAPARDPGDYYYEWRNEKFKLLKFVPVKTDN